MAARGVFLVLRRAPTLPTNGGLVVPEQVRYGSVYPPGSAIGVVRRTVNTRRIAFTCLLGQRRSALWCRVI
jgi:hypothetical protein